VLKRAQKRGPGSDLGLATVMARWRPSGGGACVASSGEAREGGEQRWERQRATRGHVQELEVELGCCIGNERRQGRSTAGGRKQSRATCGRKKKRGERSGGLVCDFQKVQVPLGKLRFLTATKVKWENAQHESSSVSQTLQHCFRAQVQKIKVYNSLG
jgi:hypothetical protein